MTMNRISSKTFQPKPPVLAGSGGESGKSGKRLPTMPDSVFETGSPGHGTGGSDWVEEHVMEFLPNNVPDSKITLALRINTRQSGDETQVGAIGFVRPEASAGRVGELQAEIDDLRGKLSEKARKRDARIRELERELASASRLAVMAGVRLDMEDGTTVYGPYKARVAAAFLADLDHFLSQDRRWGEMSLLKAAEMDHRFFARLKAGESFRIESLDTVAAAMNKAAAGELNPEDFRNIRTKGSRE